MRRGGQGHSISIRIWSDGVRGCFNTLIRSKRTELFARYFDGSGNRANYEPVLSPHDHRG